MQFMNAPSVIGKLYDALIDITDCRQPGRRRSCASGPQMAPGTRELSIWVLKDYGSWG